MKSDTHRLGKTDPKPRNRGRIWHRKVTPHYMWFNYITKAHSVFFIETLCRIGPFWITCQLCKISVFETTSLEVIKKKSHLFYDAMIPWKPTKHWQSNNCCTGCLQDDSLAQNKGIRLLLLPNTFCFYLILKCSFSSKPWHWVKGYLRR